MHSVDSTGARGQIEMYQNGVADGDEEEQSLQGNSDGNHRSAHSRRHASQDSKESNLKMGFCGVAWFVLLFVNVWTLLQLRESANVQQQQPEWQEALIGTLQRIEEHSKKSSMLLEAWKEHPVATSSASAGSSEKDKDSGASEPSSTSDADADATGNSTNQTNSSDSDDEDEEDDDDDGDKTCDKLSENTLHIGTWSLLVNYTEDALFLAIAEEEMQRPFIILASLGRVSGQEAGYMHEVVSPEDVYFALRPQPHKKQITLFRPNHDIRLAPGESYSEAMREGWGDDIGWVKNIPAWLCEGDNLTNGSIKADWPAKVGAEARSNVTVVLNIFDWVTDGMSVLEDRDCSGARLLKVAAFERNLQFVLMCSNGWRSEEIHFSLAFLPDEPMEIRRLDDRVGYFGSSYEQLGPVPVLGALAGSARTSSKLEQADADRRINFITRWRLNKKKGGGGKQKGLVEPEKPIVFHMDPTVPRPLWETLKKGVLYWTEAFEEIGFKDAVQVILPSDESWPLDYDVSDIRFSSISWLPYPGLGLAIGPSHIDPRTGEILYANIMFGEGWIPAITGDWYESATLGVKEADQQRHGPPAAETRRLSHMGACHMREHLPNGKQRCLGPEEPARRVTSLHAKLVAQGAISFGDNVPPRFLEEALRDIVSHEVGHTLGLRHNFRASAMYGPDEIHEQSKKTGRVAASVMDYIDAVVAEDPAKQGAYFMQGVGVYDKWCIKYGYSELSGATAEARYEELLAIANEVESRPELLRGDDEDSRHRVNDAYVTPYDLTADPPVFCRTEARMVKRILVKMKDFYLKADPVWHRQAEHVYHVSHRQVASLWHYCGYGLIPFLRGITYDRSKRDALSKPVSLEVRIQALETLSLLLSDDELTMPSIDVMRRGAFYLDGTDKWGLVTPYEEWLQSAVNYPKTLLNEITDFDNLRWIDTLVWIDEQLNQSSIANPASIGDWDIVRQLLPWAGVVDSGFVLARMTACLLRPLFSNPPEAKKSEFQLAVQAWWLDRLVVLHTHTANATAAGKANFGFFASFLGVEEDNMAPFNFHVVHMALNSIVHQIAKRLEELQKTTDEMQYELHAFLGMLQRTLQLVT